jgi:hypothetical protein
VLPCADCALLAVHLGSGAQIVGFLAVGSVLPFLLLGFCFSTKVTLTRFQLVESCLCFSRLVSALASSSVRSAASAPGQDRIFSPASVIRLVFSVTGSCSRTKCRSCASSFFLLRRRSSFCGHRRPVSQFRRAVRESGIHFVRPQARPGIRSCTSFLICVLLDFSLAGFRSGVRWTVETLSCSPKLVDFLTAAACCVV